MLFRSDSAVHRYSCGFYAFPIPDRSVFRYSYGFYLIPIVPRILPFIGLHADSTLFRYLTVQFLVVARILLDPGNPSVSAIYPYTRGFYHFPIPDWSVFSYSHGFCLITVVPWILLFMKIHADSTLFRYPTGQFFGTDTDST